MEFCFDLDGIITVEREGHDYHKRTLNEHTLATIEKLYSKGHLVSIYTSRMDIDWVNTMEWLKEKEVPFHRLIMGKPKADAYVDDMAVPEAYLVEWLDSGVLSIPCWREIKKGRKRAVCEEILQNLEKMPLLSKITVIRCLRQCQARLFDKPSLTGPVDMDVVIEFTNMMRFCRNDQ